MQIEERNVGDVKVLDLKGKITLGEGDELLKDKVNSLVNQGRELFAKYCGSCHEERRLPQGNQEFADAAIRYCRTLW